MTDPSGSPPRSTRSLLPTSLLIAVLLGIFVWRSGKLGPPEVVPPDGRFVPTPLISDVESPRVGYFSPDFHATTLSSRPVRLSDLRGKAVFMNFWAPWCGPCKAEMAAIGDLAKRAPKTVSVLTIAVDAREADVRSFIDKNGVQFPVIHDDDGDLGARFQISGIPTTLLLDHRGVIVSRIVGPRDWGREEFVSWMARLAEPDSE